MTKNKIAFPSRLALGLAACLLATLLRAQTPQHLAARRLPTGKIIAPAGTAQNVGSLPMNIARTPDNKFALVSDMGFREYLTCLNAHTGKLAANSGAQITFPTTKADTANGLYYGLAMTANGDGTDTAYVAQGARGCIAVVQVSANGTLRQTGTITMRPGDFPAGLALDAAGRLYVAVNGVNGQNPLAMLMTPGSLVVYDTHAPGVVTLLTTPATPAPEVRRVIFNGPQDTFGQISPLFGKAVPFTPSNYPFAVAALANGSEAFVSSQRDGGVFAVPMTGGPDRFVKTGAHPDALRLSKDQTTLYVANGQSDSISLVNTRTLAVRTVSLRPRSGTGRLPGVTPTGLALAPDGHTLYATLGDWNAVAVIAVPSGRILGDIPTGWYPSAVALVPGANGSTALLVTEAKGVNAVNPNPQHVKPTPANPAPGAGAFYDENLIEGAVSRIVPSHENLRRDTATVLADNHLAEAAADPLPRQILGMRGIKHVIYIIKENRTYDQILGDMRRGNGDPALAIFGQNVTPNQHALARRFVLLDNFDDCAEVSADGWTWSTQGIANEYVIRNVPYNYSGRGREYDFEGQNNGYPTGGFPAKTLGGTPTSPLLFPQGAPRIPNVATAPGGHLWDAARRAGLSYRNYGFFDTFGVTSAIPDNYPSSPNLQPGGHYHGGALLPSKNGRTDVDFRRFDLDYPDSSGPQTGYSLTSYGRYHTRSRFAEWNREFQAMLRSAPNGKDVPALMLVRFMSDHTAGYKLGQATPTGHVADNDYAVGQLVQAVSHSPIWKSTAIFVVEDDPQDGPDHVDCHRSTAFVISPYIKPGSIDHHFYNTDSLLRTMELILGLPPMSQYDATAAPINDFAAHPVNAVPYTALLPGVISQTAARRLPPHSPLQKLVRLTAAMDFSREDLAPPQRLNRVIWQSVKGVGSRMPAPRLTQP